MATERRFIEDVLDRLVPLEVSAKPMFGEYGLYHRGKNFALVCDNTLFIKVTEPGAILAGRTTRGAPYPGAKPAFRISAKRLADHDWLVELVEVTSAALAPPTPRLKRTR